MPNEVEQQFREHIKEADGEFKEIRERDFKFEKHLIEMKGDVKALVSQGKIANKRTSKLEETVMRMDKDSATLHTSVSQLWVSFGSYKQAREMSRKEVKKRWWDVGLDFAKYSITGVLSALAAIFALTK